MSGADNRTIPDGVPVFAWNPPSRREMAGLHRVLRHQVANWGRVELQSLASLLEARLARRGRLDLFYDATRVRYDPRDRAIRLRTGAQLDCASFSELLFLMFAIQVHAALRLDEPLDSLLGDLQRIYRRVLTELRGQYDDADFYRAATGGVPGSKEVLLYALVRRARPRLAVETGVAQGVSSVFLLEAMERNGSGRLISVDLPNYDPRGRAEMDDPHGFDGTFVKRDLGVGWLVPSELRTRWELILGDSREVLQKLTANELDLFYHDSEHSYLCMQFEYRWAIPRLAPGGLLLSDDINRNSAFMEAVADHASGLRGISTHRFGIAQRAGPGGRSS
jgi:predicted O-methyltransferase YrrM